MDELSVVKRLSCEGSASGCRFLIQSENEDELVDIAQKHMKEQHDKDFTDREIRDALETV